MFMGLYLKFVITKNSKLLLGSQFNSVILAAIKTACSAWNGHNQPTT
jgi:hypothetical protein